MNKLITALVLIYAIFLLSCEANLKDKEVEKDASISPRVVVPVASASADFGKFIQLNYKRGNIKLNNDGIDVCLVYQDSISHSLPSQMIISMPVSFEYNRNWLNFEFYSPNVKYLDSKLQVTMKTNVGSLIAYAIDSLFTYNYNDATIPKNYAWFEHHTTKSYFGQFPSVPQKPGEWTSVNFELNQSNGEIDKLYDYQHDTFFSYFTLWATTTPSFIPQNPMFKLYITAIQPFNFDNGSYMTYKDTVDNVFDDVADEYDKNETAKKIIKSATAVLNITNGLPCNAHLQLHFLDSNKQEFPVTFKTNYYIESGNVNSDGIVTAGNEKQTTIYIDLTPAQLTDLRKAASIAFDAKVEGKDLNSKIHFIQQNTLKFQLGLYVDTNININDL